MTATGREAGRALGDRVVAGWLPYDMPFAVRAFLAHFPPAPDYLMETELWPNLVAHARNGRVPLFLVNARLSARSPRGYRRFAALTQPMLARLSGVAAQTDRRRAAAGRGWARAGRSPAISSSTPWSRPPRSALGADVRAAFRRDTTGLDRRMTREGEETLMLDALGRRRRPQER